MNIWHNLAENALVGKYDGQYRSISQDIDETLEDSFSWYMTVRMDDIIGDFYGMTPEEQCLFLLFCGESYEH